MKPPGAVQHPGDPILLPTHLRSDEVDYECELAVVIGTAVQKRRRERALDYVLGYTCANDVSARDWQIKRGGSQWCRGKSSIRSRHSDRVSSRRDEIPNPNALRINTMLNGEAMQDWTTRTT